MIHLLNNIEQEFSAIDKELREFNEDIETNPIESNAIQKLSQLNFNLSERLKEVKLNMAAFDMAIKIQKLDTVDLENRKTINSARSVVEDSLTRLIKNKHQLMKLCESSSPMTTTLQVLLENIKEWEFLLTKHLQQYATILS